MEGLPLHPAIVHIPLGLSLVVPLLAAVAALAVWKGWMDRQVWIGVIAVQAILFGGGLLAQETGGDEEEVVEHVVAEERIEEHEEKAETFVTVAGVTLAVSVAAFFIPAETLALAAMGLTVLLSLAVLGLGVAVGHSGGKLVFVHGAARAYEQNAGAARAGRPVPADDDDGPARTGEQGEHE